MPRASVFAGMLAAVLFFTLFTSVDTASAGCWTSQPGCAGTVLFNFCLPPRMSRSEWVVTGDSYCYQYGNEVPESCVRHELWVP